MPADIAEMAARVRMSGLGPYGRAASLALLPHRLLSLDSSGQTKKIPVTLDLGGWLHLEQVDRVDLAAVLPYPSRAKAIVITRQGFHLLDCSTTRCLCLCWTHGICGLEVVQHRRVGAGMVGAWIDVWRHF